MHQTILIIDDDPDITDALSVLLEAPGRTLVVCADVESAELATDRFAVTDVVSDVQFSGRFGFEGLHFLERIRTKLGDARIVLMTGFATDALRENASAYGVTAVLAKPFEVAELEAVLSPHDETSEAPFELIRIPAVDAIIAEGRLFTVFQPILSAANAEPFAFEALARVKGGWEAGGVAELFTYAAKKSRSAELNRAALVNAIESAAALPESSLIFINVDPPTFSDRRLISDVIDTAARANVALDRIVLEITERVALNDDAASAEAFATLRAHGVRFALDDHCSAYSHLATIASIRPSFIKISGVFGTGFESDQDKQRVIRHVLALAHDFGCATVLEGIETETTADAAGRLGVDLVQGYYFSKPQVVSFWREVAA